MRPGIKPSRTKKILVRLVVVAPITLHDVSQPMIELRGCDVQNLSLNRNERFDIFLRPSLTPRRRPGAWSEDQAQQENKSLMTTRATEVGDAAALLL